MNKIFKKVLCATLATATLAGGAIAFGGCTTNRPEVEMQISFNGKTYTLEYQLFRKLAPNTVEHFLVLAENGYYNGVCVHDYTSSKWYTGGYTYDAAKEETGGLVYKDYFSIVSAYENKDFVSVWKDSEKATPTYTLYGEFSANGMKMDKGDFLSQSFGSLSMVYEDKGDGEYDVYVDRVDGNGMRKMAYEKNSATSMFSINLTSSGIDASHATFATLKEDFSGELTSLTSAVNAYIKANFPESADDEDAPVFAEEYELEQGLNDPFISEAELTVEYEVPAMPIIIKSVKVLKY